MDPTLITEAAPYLPAVAYLSMVSVLVRLTQRVPEWTHPVVLVLGLTARVLQSGWQEPAITTGVALIFFVIMVPLAARTVSGVSLFAIIIALALTPLGGWLGIVLGLCSAAIVALVRTWRTLGKSRVVWITSDTLSAMGLAPSGFLKAPEPSLVPGREALTDVSAPSDQANRLRMYLPPYLLFGVCVSVAATLIVK